MNIAALFGKMAVGAAAAGVTQMIANRRGDANRTVAIAAGAEALLGVGGLAGEYYSRGATAGVLGDLAEGLLMTATVQGSQLGAAAVDRRYLATGPENAYIVDESACVGGQQTLTYSDGTSEVVPCSTGTVTSGTTSGTSSGTTSSAGSSSSSSTSTSTTAAVATGLGID